MPKLKSPRRPVQLNNYTEKTYVVYYAMEAGLPDRRMLRRINVPTERMIRFRTVAR